MNIFPTRILLATDGSEDAAHATEVTVELSKKTDSELHVVYVGEDAYSGAWIYPAATDPQWVEQEDPTLREELGRQFEQILAECSTRRLRRYRRQGGRLRRRI